MAKKKDNPQVINNIQELNLEIDYNKLAEAIVKAQEKSENEANKSKKFHFLVENKKYFVKMGIKKPPHQLR